MKRHPTILFALFLICLSLAGCSGDNAIVTEDTPNPDAQANSETTASTDIQAPSIGSADVDIDLTMLSSTMVYAEVYNIMANPEEYMGRTIKMSGPYYAVYYDATDQYYHYVIIEDATACCQQGLEFIWSGNHVYPDEYPADQIRVEVEGIFDSYEELGETYYYLAVDDMLIMDW